MPSRKSIFPIGTRGGYLTSEPLDLPVADSAGLMVANYLGSTSFRTGFLLPDVDTVHGPFRLGELKQADFQVLTRGAFAATVDEIQSLEIFCEESACELPSQWAQIRTHLALLKQENEWFTMLLPNEESTGRHHDSGYVFWVFREFLLGRPGSETCRRLLFAYD